MIQAMEFNHSSWIRPTYSVCAPMHPMIPFATGYSKRFWGIESCWLTISIFFQLLQIIQQPLFSISQSLGMLQLSNLLHNFIQLLSLFSVPCIKFHVSFNFCQLHCEAVSAAMETAASLVLHSATDAVCIAGSQCLTKGSLLICEGGRI